MENLLNTWRWNQSFANQLCFPFESAGQILNNFSQAWQDIFILSMLEGKTDGLYLEVGGHVPIENNNTYLLHKFFAWRGVTLEMDPSHIHAWIRERPESILLTANALHIDYAELISVMYGESIKRIDYLQLDIDPSINTLKVLKRMPLDTHRFSVITFETDAYSLDFRARDESREILRSHGYELVAKDVCVYFSPVSSAPIPFEDWWVDPTIISADKINKLKAIQNIPLLPQNVLFANN